MTLQAWTAADVTLVTGQVRGSAVSVVCSAPSPPCLRCACFRSCCAAVVIRLYYNTGARLSEVGKLSLEDLNQDTDSVHYHGKGNKDRLVRYGPKTARAISRYLRARAKPN